MKHSSTAALCGSLALLFLLLAFAPVAQARDQYYAWPDSADTKRRVVRGATEVFLANFVVWTFDRYIRPAPEGGEKGAGFKVGFNSWWENIKNGFEWDDNNFGTNQWGHPYHGALFYTAGRANGFDFWESAPFAFAGSFAWEYFGETHHPAFNDWINTSVGGVALGEVLHRTSTMVLDNRASGSERVWREIGAAVIDPVRGFNRLITGQASHKYANPANRFPDDLGLTLEYGLRTDGDDRIWDSPVTRGFFRADLAYGDPFHNRRHIPFSDFLFNVQINFADASPIGLFNARGILAGMDLHKTDTSRHILASYHHFDYMDNSAVLFGAQSVGVTLLSELLGEQGDEGLALRTTIDGNLIILGATEEDYSEFTGRNYDYGPGGSLKVGAGFFWRGTEVFTVKSEQHFIHSINGTKANHFISESQIGAKVPFVGRFGLALDYLLFLRDSQYEFHPNVSKRSPEIRLSLFSGFYR